MFNTKPLSSSKKRKVVQVILLNGEQCQVYVDIKSKFLEVFNQVASNLCLREVEYFGLAFKKENEYQFVALDEKIHKQAPKKWKTGQGEGYDSQNEAILKVWFRVQFYVDQVVLLREKVTRHLYYLQLKENILQYSNINSEERCFQMVGNALQADHGSFTPERHSDQYFDAKNYFPQWIIEKRGLDYIQQNTPKIHQENRNLTRSDAELKYIKEASVAPSANNLHFYRVKKKKSDKLWNTWLAVCPRGIEIYEEVSPKFKNLISVFLWHDIGRLYFDKKKFEIRAEGCPEGRKFTYYTESDITSKYLLTICRATHMFQLEIQPKLMEIRHLDAEDKRRYRESYIYSDARDLVANGNWIQHRPVKLSPSKSGSSCGNQRFSVVSDVSSNTTSGIVSDKMTISFDESDDHSKEILIDTPPGSGSSTTPSTPRSKFSNIIRSFHNYKKSTGSQSPASSPRSLELYKSRSPGMTPTQLSPVTSPGTYRSAPVYGSRNPGFTLHSPPLIKSERESKSRPVSRNVSRKESLKNQLSNQQPLEVRSDQSPASPSAESKALSLGISVLPNKPICPLFVSSAPSSFSQPFLPVTSHKPSETTPSPSSSSGIGLTPGSETSLPLYPLGYTSSSVVTTPGSEASSTVYHLGYTSISTGHSPIDPVPPLYNLAYPKSTAGNPPSEPIQITNIHGLPIAAGGISPKETSYNLAYQNTSGLTPSETQAVYNLSFGGPTSGVTPPEQLTGVYNLGYANTGNLPTRVPSPPPYHLSFPSSSSNMTQIEPAAPIYHNVGFALGHTELPKTPTYMNLPDPPPYSTALSQLASSEKLSSPGIKPNKEGFNLIPLNHSPPKFSPGITPLSDSAYYPVNKKEIKDGKFPDAQDLFSPPLAFSDTSSVVAEIPVTRGQSLVVPKSAVPEFSEKLDTKAEDARKEKKKEEGIYTKKKQHHHHGKKNHGEKLHPELQVIRSHAQSFPLITALCNDTSLMHTNSVSSAGSYDTSTMKSNNSRLSGSSVELDSRRWSACCPSDSGTMITNPTIRPKSWHSEHFDLDTAQFQASQGNAFLNSIDNHRSVPQNLQTITPPPSWTNAVSISGEFKGSTEKYPPEYLAQQHMIPVKLNSGGHSKTEDCSVKTLKETFGMA